MVYNLYSIYDSLSEEYGPIFHAKNPEVAKRAVKTILNEAYSISDFDLYELGVFNTETGTIVPYNEKNFVCNVSDILNLEGEVEE